MQKLLISVIVPVYNREQLVPKTIESVLSQTYKNFELILIDDGSTDSSYNVCKKYADNDSKISLFTQKNSGVGAARNLGIEKSKGEYICFVDSDDTVESDLLQCYVSELQQKDFDLVVCGCRNCLSNGDTKFFELPNNDFDDITEFWNNFGDLLDVNLLRFPGNKLYKKELLLTHDIFFDKETQIAEDALFNARYYEIMNTISVIKKPLYNWRMHDSDSGLSNSFHESFFSAQAKLFPMYINLLKKHNCFSGNNFDVVSRQYSDLMCKGLRDAYSTLGVLKLSEVKKNLITEIFPVSEKSNYFLRKFGKAVLKNDTSYLKKLYITKSLIKIEIAKEAFINTKNIMKKSYLMAKIVLWRIILIFESVIKIKQIKNCQVV